MELNPSLVDFIMTATAKLRWDEQGAMPNTQVRPTNGIKVHKLT